MSIDADAFVSLVRPALETGDVSQMARVISYRWTGKQVATLLDHADADVRRLAAVAVGLIGERDDACRLARCLQDNDEQVVRMAEHGLWTLWFRDGSEEAQEPFERGLNLLGQHKLEEAIASFEQAYKLDPNFAEAYNQCAMAHEMLEQWREGIADCRLAIERMPCHFGAMACMGHCFAQLNDLRRALLCYREALRVHPRMLGVRTAAERLECCLGNVNDHSGHFDCRSIY
ncbi:MAG: tetratricopeptide repeat protein [Phycisphaeraceae bacterium]|nr:tetratricopeptide repeat protein [Phycisphaeraceae bacterium]